MRNYWWVILGWIWFWVAPGYLNRPAYAASPSLQDGSCEAQAMPRCARKPGEQVTFTFTMSAGFTTYFVATHDKEGVTLVMVRNDTEEREFFTPVGAATFRLHLKGWCKAFDAPDQDKAQDLATAAQSHVNAINLAFDEHAKIRGMIKTLEDMLIVAIQNEDEKGQGSVAKLKRNIEQLENEDNQHLTTIQQEQEGIKGLYDGRFPDAESVIVQLDVLGFTPKNAIIVDTVEEPTGFELVPESAEESIGFRLFKNDDDDNRNKQPDVDDGMVNRENDLGQVWWFLAKPIDETESFFFQNFAPHLATWEQKKKKKAKAIPTEVSAQFERDRVYIEGRDASDFILQEDITAVFPLDIKCMDTLLGRVDGIKEIEFLAPEESTLMFNDETNYQEGGNASMPGGGDRVFIGRNRPGENPNDKLRVRVHIRPMQAGVPIFIRPFDVDDPSSEDDPVDNDRRQGDNFKDNRGLIFKLFNGTGIEFREGFIEGMDEEAFVMKETNGDGIAEVTWCLTQQPGDNYRMTAGLRRHLLANLIVRHPDPDASVKNEVRIDLVKDPNQLNMRKQSELLTVWRQVHIERDAMANLEVLNIEAGMITGIVAGEGQAVVEIDEALLDDNQYETVDAVNLKGRLRVGGFNYFVTGNDSGPPPNTVSILLGGNPIPTVGSIFTLIDDDDNSVLPALPDIGLMQDKYEPAYLLIQDDEGGTADNNSQMVLHELNTPDAFVSFRDQLDRGLTSHSDRHRMFWIIYMQNVFQPDFPKDHDPGAADEVQDGARGGTIIEPRGGSLLMKETLRDRAVAEMPPLGPAQIVIKEQVIQVHETGHQWGFGNEGGGIMEDNDTINPTPSFTDFHLDFIRDRVRSPGQLFE